MRLLYQDASDETRGKTREVAETRACGREKRKEEKRQRSSAHLPLGAAPNCAFFNSIFFLSSCGCRAGSSRHFFRIFSPAMTTRVHAIARCAFCKGESDCCEREFTGLKRLSHRSNSNSPGRPFSLSSLSSLLFPSLPAAAMAPPPGSFLRPSRLIELAVCIAFYAGISWMLFDGAR